jgi:hypothetical protein
MARRGPVDKAQQLGDFGFTADKGREHLDDRLQ